MNSYSVCPNCKQSTTGFFNPAYISSQGKIDLINKYSESKSEAYCSKCAPALLKIITKKFGAEKTQLERRLSEIIHYIPILTSPAPAKWDYEVKDIATSQITSGTGFMTELSRGFNDLFGTTSASSNRKISKAVEICKSDLKIQCVRKGGNAIVSADIDFNEVGSGSSNMLMVCMTGTIIKVTEISFFQKSIQDHMGEIIELSEKLDAISDVTSL